MESAPTCSPNAETETKASWLTKTLVESMPGRIVMCSYESLRATGTSVAYLSPWGDANPVILPCVRGRDMFTDMINLATGGTAALAAPLINSAVNMILDDSGDSVIVEPIHKKKHLTDSVFGFFTDDDAPRPSAPPPNSFRITLKYRHTMKDALLGFFRSSVHTDVSLFSNVKDYLASENGWFSPYLFASGRRPNIPRTMSRPDIIFCFGPFLAGDMTIGETLLNASAIVHAFCGKPSPPPARPIPAVNNSPFDFETLSNVVSDMTSEMLRSQSHSRSPSYTYPSGYVEEYRYAEPPQVYDTAPYPSTPAQPHPRFRRMVLVVLGIKPHRHYWLTSARPGESVIKYYLLDGCPAVVIPIKPGAPFVGWNTLTLEEMHDIGREPGGVDSERARGVVDSIYEYLSLHVDWGRMVIQEAAGRPCGPPDVHSEAYFERSKAALKSTVRLLVISAIISGQGETAKRKVHWERAGIVMFQIR